MSDISQVGCRRPVRKTAHGSKDLVPQPPMPVVLLMSHMPAQAYGDGRHREGDGENREGSPLGQFSRNQTRHESDQVSSVEDCRQDHEMRHVECAAQ